MRFLSMVTQVCLMILLIGAQKCAAQSGVVVAGALKPFVTDGCSFWFDGTPRHPYLWRSCCVAHDKIYWIGGAREARLAADRELQACVSKVAGSGMANYIYFFVSTGGSPLWITSYRWGYGWRYMDAGAPRGYKLLSAAEEVQVAALMPLAEKVIAEDALKYPSTSARFTAK